MALPAVFKKYLPKNLFSATQTMGGEAGLISQLVGTLSSNPKLPGYFDFQRLSEEGFRRNCIVHACIRRISRSAAEAPLKAVTMLPNGDLRTDPPNEKDALAWLLSNPNEDQDQYELFEHLLLHLHVTGNAFIYKVRAGIGGPPVALELIRPDLVGILPGKDRSEGRVKGYTVRTDDTDRRIVLPKDDVIHFKLPDVLDEYWGLSPLYTAAQYGDIDLQAADFLRCFFRNRGIPSGILTFGTQMVKTERERIRELWQEQFRGEEGWHNVAVLDANVNYTPLTTGVEKLDLGHITSQTETRICMVFGVPPALISTKYGLEKSTFSNLDGSEKIFWQDTLSPLFARLSRKITRDLVHKEFSVDRQAIFDLSQVAALQQNRDEIRKVALQGFNFGLLTRNESKKLLGLPQDEVNGDWVKVVPGTIMLPIGDIKSGEMIEPSTNPNASDPTSDDTVPTGDANG